MSSSLSEKIFSIHEIEENKQLQYLFWVVLFGFFLSFRLWIAEGNETIEALSSAKSICPPYFQNCLSIAIFSSWDDYSYKAIYALMFLCLVLSGIFGFKEKWIQAQAFLLPPLVFKFLSLFVFSYSHPVDFEYFHFPMALIYLFGRQKLLYIQLNFCLIYFFAGLIKLNSTWIVADYFSSLKEGMPFISNYLAPVAANIVILTEIFLSWGLLFLKKWRPLILSYWIFFHIYSVLMVGFHYPSYCLPPLLILFYLKPKFQRVTFNFSTIVIVLLIIVHFFPQFIKGDFRYTMQMFKFGVEMFYANSQCYISYDILDGNGSLKTIEHVRSAGMKRCYPYSFWFKAKTRCNIGKKVLNFKMATSIDGGPFYQIVDIPSLCTSGYNFLKHNIWIKDPSMGAPIIGYPYPNNRYKNLYKTKNKMISSVPIIEHNSLQKFLNNNLNVIQIFYTILWWALFVMGLSFFIYKTNFQKNGNI